MQINFSPRKSFIRCYWWHSTPNFGDVVSKPILEFLTGQEVRLVGGGDPDKIMATGSIIETARPGDIIWGSGHNRNTSLKLPIDISILAVRGPITRSLISQPEVPEVYGDPAILLPLVYDPVVEKQYKVGLIPHYIDKDIVTSASGHIINIQDDWKKVVREIKKCELIISSSLHGIIAAEVYGVPAVWAVWSNRIVGEGMKYQDYFLGTDRYEQETFCLLPPISDLKEKQNVLIE